MHAVVTAVTIQFNKTVSNEVKEPSCKMAHYQSHITEKNKLFGQPNILNTIKMKNSNCKVSLQLSNRYKNFNLQILI